MSQSERDNRYVDILLTPLEKSAKYLPRMGSSRGVTLDTFVQMYSSDPLYHWMGLDSPLMFAAHKAAGGMTSIYRQLGIGSERLFRQILRDQLQLTAEQVTWSYEVLPRIRPGHTKHDPKPRRLSLDGRVDLRDVTDDKARLRLQSWIDAQREFLDVTAPLNGAVFEVRQGYKSQDSKRQNADLANAAQALGHGYLPVLTIMSNQINEVVYARYTTGNWCILMGTVEENNPHISTFDFVKTILGYDLVGFFERNTNRLRSETESILQELLEAK